MNRRALSAALLLVPFLSGCSSFYGLNDDAKPNLEEKGVLLIPVTDRALFTATGVAMTVTRDDGQSQKVVVLGKPTPIPSQDGMGYRFYAAVELVPGNYRFTSWALHRTEGGSAKEPKSPLQFTISKGEVLYVGNFNVLRILERGQFRDRYADDVEAFKAHMPWLKGIEVKSRPVPGTWWNKDGGSETPKGYAAP